MINLQSARQKLAEETCDEICTMFDSRSPFAFLSHPTGQQQLFVGLGGGKLQKGRIALPLDAGEGVYGLRSLIIDGLRNRRREVCDWGYGMSMSAGMRAIYQGDRIAKKAWFDLPYKLKKALVATVGQ
jgi:hypothetical protein